MWPKSSQADWNVGNRLLAGKNLEIHLCEDDISVTTQILNSKINAEKIFHNQHKNIPT